MTNLRAEYLKDVKRVVVKVGTSTLAHESGLLNLNRIESLVRQLSDLSNRGLEVILVTSGAVGAGMGRLGLNERPKTIPEKQACAAVGQGILMHLYEKFFSEYGKIAAQILLTREDMNHRTRFLNARNVMFDLLSKGVIPIINENDTIVVEEIKFGDNDTLSAVVASLVEADLLILLSDIDGLYNSNPNANPDAKLIPFVDKLSYDIESVAGGVGSKVGTGGMVTKINAAKIAIQSGIPMVICNGSRTSILMDVISGQEMGTLFKASANKLHSRKRWIGFASKVNGKVYIDNGAAKALKENQSSLLASGIHEIEGSFDEGDVVSVVTLNEEEIAKGIVNYSSRELQLIKRMHSYEFESVLGYKTYDEAIHRDNILVIDYAGGE